MRLRTLVGLLVAAPALPATEGFYKDIFMDGGTGLTHRTRLYAAESLGLSMEYLARDDSLLLLQIVKGSADDVNGYLLYPDGAPRFRLIYTNGGNAGRHGRALGDSGRQRIRDFVAQGGSYTGSCAGAYLAALSPSDSGVEPTFYHLWPGRTKDAGIYGAEVDHSVVPGSALLRYYDFGGDRFIANVYHNGGCWANESITWPQGTEVLVRYDTTGIRAHNKASTWAFKAAETTGRVVVTGSHPEGYYFGERLQLFMAMVRYALDGVAGPRIKGVLANGIPRVMNRATGADPAYVKIGDRQYHHFGCRLPQGATHLRVELAASDSFQLNLYLCRDSFAFRSRAQFMDTSPAGHKELFVPQPQAGTWFVGVECASSVRTYGDSCFLYHDSLGVLNGVAYTVTASWDSLGGVAETADKETRMANNGATVVRRVLHWQPGIDRRQSATVLMDGAGHKVMELQPGANDIRHLAPGVYFVRVARAPGRLANMKVIVIR